MAVQRAEALYNFEPTADVELQLRVSFKSWHDGGNAFPYKKRIG